MGETAMEMMVGSEGKEDYLIIAYHGQAAIGLKPVIEPFFSKETGEAFLLGARVRLAAAPGKALISAKHVANTIYHMIPWQKYAEDRVSVFLGAVVPPFPTNMKAEVLIGNLEKSGFFPQIQDCITPIFEVASDTPYTPDEVITYIQKQYRVLLKQYMQSSPSATDFSKVIPFKPKK